MGQEQSQAVVVEEPTQVLQDRIRKLENAIIQSVVTLERMKAAFSAMVEEGAKNPEVKAFFEKWVKTNDPLKIDGEESEKNV
jgi:hypothetical protein